MSKTESPTFQKPPRFIVTAQDRSAGKTFTAALLASYGQQCGYEVCILQNDSQKRLDMYGEVIKIPLATSSEVMENELADVDKHEGLLALIRELETNPKKLIIYDTSAGSIGRIPIVFDSLSIADRLTAMGEFALVVVPLTARNDIAASAVATMKAMSKALPGHYIVPIKNHRDGSPNDLPADHAFHAALRLAKHGFLSLPHINKQAALLLEQTTRPLHHIADPQGPVSALELASELGTTEGRAEVVMTTARHILAGTLKEANGLGFQLGA